MNVKGEKKEQVFIIVPQKKIDNGNICYAPGIAVWAKDYSVARGLAMKSSRLSDFKDWGFY